MATQKQAGKTPQARRTPQPGRAAQAGTATQAGQAARGGRATQAGKAPQSAKNAPGGKARSGSAKRAGTGAQADPAARKPRSALLGYIAAHKLEFTTFVVSLLGLAVSIYLTKQHFTQGATYAGCPENSLVNCGRVTSSAQSHFLGIPVAVLGLAFYVFMVAVNSPWGWRARYPAVHWARLISVIVGIVFVLYLVYAELFLINAICLYCTSVHVLTFILFGLIISRAASRGVGAVPAGS